MNKFNGSVYYRDQPVFHSVMCALSRRICMSMSLLAECSNSFWGIQPRIGNTSVKLFGPKAKKKVLFQTDSRTLVPTVKILFLG